MTGNISRSHIMITLRECVLDSKCNLQKGFIYYGYSHLVFRLLSQSKYNIRRNVQTGITYNTIKWTKINTLVDIYSYKLWTTNIGYSVERRWTCTTLIICPFTKPTQNRNTPKNNRPTVAILLQNNNFLCSYILQGNITNNVYAKTNDI